MDISTNRLLVYMDFYNYILFNDVVNILLLFTIKYNKRN